MKRILCIILTLITLLGITNLSAVADYRTDTHDVTWESMLCDIKEERGLLDDDILYVYFSKDTPVNIDFSNVVSGNKSKPTISNDNRVDVYNTYVVTVYGTCVAYTILTGYVVNMNDFTEKYLMYDVSNPEANIIDTDNTGVSIGCVQIDDTDVRYTNTEIYNLALTDEVPALYETSGKAINGTAGTFNQDGLSKLGSDIESYKTSIGNYFKSYTEIADHKDEFDTYKRSESNPFGHFNDPYIHKVELVFANTPQVTTHETADTQETTETTSTTVNTETTQEDIDPFVAHSRM